MAVGEQILSRRGVTWTAQDQTAQLVLPAAFGHQHRMEFAAVEGRVRAGLVLAGKARPLDLSLQPGVAERLVEESATFTGGGRDLHAAVASHLLDFVSGVTRWRPTRDGRDLGVARAVGGAAWPILAACFDAGSAAVRDVPRWTARGLSQPDARRACEELLGP